jgi:hypothetical protein
MDKWYHHCRHNSAAIASRSIELEAGSTYRGDDSQ